MRKLKRVHVEFWHSRKRQPTWIELAFDGQRQGSGRSAPSIDRVVNANAVEVDSKAFWRQCDVGNTLALLRIVRNRLALQGRSDPLIEALTNHVNTSCPSSPRRARDTVRWLNRIMKGRRDET